MAGNLDGFDATTVDPDVGFEPVPKGAYLSILTDSKFESTKAGDGEFLWLKWEIVEGEYKGRAVIDRLNLKNKNGTTVKIAQAALSAICHAVGILKPKDSEELHNKTVMVSVALEPYKDGFSNSVKGYKAANGAASSAEIPKGDGEANSTPPWKR